MTRYKHSFKKHRYDPVFISEINQDKDYYLLFFSFMCVKEKDIFYIPKRRKNGDFTMLCPFHHEKKPSFRINAKNNCYKCFGCGKGGDVVNFYEEYYHLSFTDAVAKALSFKKVPFATKQRKINALVQSKQFSLDFTEKDLDLDLPF